MTSPRAFGADSNPRPLVPAHQADQCRTCCPPVEFLYATDESKITELAGITLSQYYADLRVMVAAQDRATRVVAEQLGVERSGYVLSRGHFNGAEYLGCEVAWPEDEEPMVSRPALGDPDKIRTFQVPPAPDNPVAQRELARARQFYELTGQRTTVGFEGPVSTAALCLGLDTFYLLAAEDPGLCELLVQKVTDACIQWKLYHDSEMGAERANVIVCGNVAALVSGRLTG